ncbi:4-alpha-glucanotransferase [Sphingomonas sp. TZW2008]|uniref:4-alpha-glucanotransferase n=1 Tax=Sphingomonas sp. TZW2008 TaxID=1917973 RepID=UPI001C4F0ACF|nr:4-alpha-glucanotransferase [Sphingomonas sp. TZW2008]
MTAPADTVQAVGLQRDWTDANGRAHRVDNEVLEAIAACLDPAPPDQPFLSAETGNAMALPAWASGKAVLRLEAGSTRELTIDNALMPPISDTGYHCLEIAGRTMTLAIAPPRCPQPPGRGWGVAVQIPSLRGGSQTAFGDFGTLGEAASAFACAGASAVAISPTHAILTHGSGAYSPYSPSSRLFHNTLFADAPRLGAAPPVDHIDPLIDWHRAIPDRLADLRRAFDTRSDDVRTAVETYRTPRATALDRHALFEALHAHFGGGWRGWPSAYHDPAGPAVADFAGSHRDAIDFHAFLQWLADDGLAEAQQRALSGMPIGLIADLAVGMIADGSHAWSRRDELLSGLTIGAPPDPLGPQGQNWGITALDPFALARTSFTAFIETIRATLAHAGGIRIDHALGLDRLWVIPEGVTAAEGAYLTMPGAHLKRIVAIEAQRANAIVIAEDLGTVPPGFRADLARRGMLGMRVLPFERDGKGHFVPPRRWDADAVAMTGTHDTPTLAGWWTGRDIEWRRTLGHDVLPDAEATRQAERIDLCASLELPVEGADDAAPIDAILSSVAQAPAPLAIVPLEDMLGLVEQPNIPGTVTEHPNWRRRMPASTAALLDDPPVAARVARLTSERPG